MQNYNKRVKETVAVLAMCGWEKGTLEDTLCDCFQVRRIGLWNFVSIQKELDRGEDIRVAKELSGDTEANYGEDSPKKKEDEVAAGKGRNKTEYKGKWPDEEGVDGPNGLPRRAGGNPAGAPCTRHAQGGKCPFKFCSYSHKKE